MTTDVVALTERPKVPMAVAAATLAELCDRIDAGESIGEAVVALFDEKRLELCEAVDRRIAFDQWIKGAIEAARAARDEWGKRVEQLREAHERFKANTKAIVEAAPDLPYRGALGSIAVQKSPPAVDVAWGSRELDDETIAFFGVDPRFVKTKVTHTLDVTAVKDALKAGETLDWARLTQSNHVRFKKG